MNASTIIDENMTLDEKLAAIDAAMSSAQSTADDQASANGSMGAPIDPASLTVCDGCE